MVPRLPPVPAHEDPRLPASPAERLPRPASLKVAAADPVRTASRTPPEIRGRKSRDSRRTRLQLLQPGARSGGKPSSGGLLCPVRASGCLSVPVSECVSGCRRQPVYVGRVLTWKTPGAGGFSPGDVKDCKEPASRRERWERKRRMTVAGCC